MHILKGFSYVRTQLGVKALLELFRLGIWDSWSKTSVKELHSYSYSSGGTGSKGTRLLVQDPEWGTTEPFKSSKNGKITTFSFLALGTTGQPKSGKAQVTAPAAPAGAHWLFPSWENTLHLNATWLLTPRNSAREANYSIPVSTHPRGRNRRQDRNCAERVTGAAPMGTAREMSWR